jgi:hypothetical protein
MMAPAYLDSHISLINRKPSNIEEINCLRLTE